MRFPDVGEKRLLLAWAPLQKAMSARFRQVCTGRAVVTALAGLPAGCEIDVQHLVVVDAGAR